ncbi:MAG: Lrp/AsnC family transcriptional regulator [Xanthomonadales bacterium]|nr:Lrp/AsnC family transcriptional regulator [Xanthomonadales bacterium]
MAELDRIDRQILAELQRDGRLSNQELARRVSLSPSPCLRRVRQLEEAGIIGSYVAILDPKRVGLPVIAYAHISLDNHHPDTVESFDELVAELPEVMECCAMAGEYDYLLKVRVASMEEYERFLRHGLLQHVGVRAVNTSFVLSQRKYTTALPVEELRV